jgi:hypothetical protein
METTWASGAIELLRHADEHMGLDSAFDKRIAFISIDNAVETAIRTFINLPQGKSGVPFPGRDVNDAGNNFPKLVALVFRHASERVAGLDDGDIEHYHRIRNQLYHDGTGLSVDERYLKAYRQIACILLENLFDVSFEVQVTEEASLENLVLLWNQIESTLTRLMSASGIDSRHTFKWEQAVQAGILDSELLRQITELRSIRNLQVHASSDQLDQERIKLGIALGKRILRELEG